MKSVKMIRVLLLAGFFSVSACNLKMSAPEPGNPIATAVAQTVSAQTRIAVDLAASNAILAQTPSPTFTTTPEPPMISVSVNTNCRVGPGKAYDNLGYFLVGEKAQIVGRAPDGEFWVIRLPKNPTTLCWVWGYYASLSGDIRSLPVIEPPPTPTPVPNFNLTYHSFGVGPGYECFMFTVQNTGATTWESYSLTFKNSAHGTNLTESSNQFIGYDQWCQNPGTQSDLMAGESGTATIKTNLSYNPIGESFEISLTLCTDNALAGTCATKTIIFSPQAHPS